MHVGKINLKNDYIFDEKSLLKTDVEKDLAVIIYIKWFKMGSTYQQCISASAFFNFIKMSETKYLKSFTFF